MTQLTLDYTPATIAKLRKGDPCPLVQDGELCAKPILGREMCAMHYARWQKHDDPLHQMRRYVAQGPECAHDGCGQKPKRRGFCGKHAKRDELYGETTEPRERKFWAQVDRRGPDECWPWLGYIAPNGYGQFGGKGAGTQLPHRIAYEHEVGPIPRGLVLDHLCHTRDPACVDTNRCPHRRCCNPRHLEPCTRGENVARGRSGDSWGWAPEPRKPKPAPPTICAECSRTDKPVYKSGKCRPCYRKWLKDPNVERPSQRTPEQRFWAKVDKNGPMPPGFPGLGPCWVWTASINPKTGYGQFFPSRGHGEDGHRFSYRLEHGSIPEGHDVHHRCHVRHCVNPAHLDALPPGKNRTIRLDRRTT